MIQKLIEHPVVRFLIVGSSVAVVQFLIFFILDRFLYLPSIVSSTVSFAICIFINFRFQKFWSFKDPSRDHIGTQFSYFVINSISNLFINILAMALLLGVFTLNKYLAQIFSLAVIAVYNFFVYKFIFKKNQ
jgi:putative flippase GtrA